MNVAKRENHDLVSNLPCPSGDGATVHVSYGLYEELEGEGDQWILGIDRPEECVSIVLKPTELMHFADLLFKMGMLQLPE